MWSISVNQRTSKARQFYAGLAILDEYGVDLRELVHQLIDNCPLAEIAPVFQAIAHGIYLQQHDYPADWLIGHGFSESEIVLLQAIALVCRASYPLDTELYSAELTKTCGSLPIANHLKQMYQLLRKGHSVGTAQYQISDPILLGIYLFLYSPYTWNKYGNIASTYNLEKTTEITACSLSRIYLGAVPREQGVVKEASEQLFRYWSGMLNYA